MTSNYANRKEIPQSPPPLVGILTLQLLALDCRRFPPFLVCPNGQHGAPHFMHVSQFWGLFPPNFTPSSWPIVVKPWPLHISAVFLEKCLIPISHLTLHLPLLVVHCRRQNPPPPCNPPGGGGGSLWPLPSTAPL